MAVRALCGYITGMETPAEQAAALVARAKQWDRFAEWESAQEVARERSLSADLAWLWDAILLARRLAPEENDLDAVRERAQRRARIRLALSAIDPPAA